MTRVAAVDLGTNSTRLLVADVDGEQVDAVVRRSVVTRLGEGVDARRRLLPVPVARVRNVLADYRRELEELAPSARSPSRRARCVMRRTARPSSARSNGRTASRRGCSPATRRRS